MDNKEKLNVRFDLKQGVYILTRGADTIIKSISDYNYDEKSMEQRRTEIEKELLGLREAPSELKKQLDVALYDALEEFDNIHGTSYRQAYFKTTTMQISTTVSEKTKDFQKRFKAEKAKALEDAGMSIEYGLSLAGGNLDFSKRLQAFKLALLQRKNGIGINFNSKSEGLDPIYTGSDKPVKTEKTSKLPKVQDIKTMAMERLKGVQTALQEQFAKLKSVDLTSKLKMGAKKGESKPEPKVNPGQQPKVNHVQPPNAEPVQQPVQQPVQTPKQQPVQQPVQPQKPEPKPQPKPQVKQQPKQQPKSQQKSGSQNKSKASNTPKKESRKEKTIRLRREAANQKKAKLKGKKEAQRRVLEAKKASGETRKQKEARAAREAQLKNEAKLSTRIKKLVLGKKSGSKNQEEHLVKRFTRTLKDKADSIRNKVHIPEILKEKKRIAGAVGAIILAGAIGITAYTMNSNRGTADYQDPSTNVTQTTETPTDNTTYQPGTVENLGATTNTDTTPAPSASTTTPSTGTPSTTTPGTENNNPGKEDDGSVPGGVQTPATNENSDRDEYLSSVRVGSTMNIQEGRYFECPDGTGNYGYFENYQDGAKELTIIGISTYEGYTAIRDSSVSLKDLKEQYPDAKFSYHFVCRHPDGRTTILGWLTEDSMQQTKDGQNNIHLQMDEER